MNRLCNASPPLCTRCQVNPRLKKQRWCRQCLTAAQRTRRAAQQTAQSEAVSATVTHAEIQAMPHVTQAPAPGLSEVQRQALEEYQTVLHEWQIRQQTRRKGWLPQDRSTILVQLTLRVERARQRLVALGINLKALEGE